MGVAELSAALWRERQLLDLLLFKLEEEQLVLAHGRSCWLGHATREVEQVLDQIRTAEFSRAIEADGAAGDFGVPVGSDLLALAKAAPQPWPQLLTNHREAFISLSTQIQQVADGNRTLLVGAERLPAAAHLALVPTTGKPDLLRLHADPAQAELDLAVDLVQVSQQTAYEAALRAAARVLQPTLLDFLR
jgi:hypothetical protein